MEGAGAAVIFAYSRRGSMLGLTIRDFLKNEGWAAELMTVTKYARDIPEARDLGTCSRKVYQEAFSRAKLLIFVGAVGIAVRSVAPFVKSKVTDPAVLDIDVGGNYVIPLLSGHIGGANILAAKLAEHLQAQPILTTATEVQHLFAVDEWAVRHGMELSSLKAAKDFAAALVDGQKLGMISDFPVRRPLPAGLQLVEKGLSSLPKIGLAISLRPLNSPFTETLQLRPKILHLGLGCRAGTSAEAIESLVQPCLKKWRLSLSLAVGAASIDVKQHEAGLLTWAAQHHLPIRFYTAAELQAVPGKFTASAFVKKTVGVDNVCERAAVLDSSGGKLLWGKTCGGGVTLAVAVEPLTVDLNDK